MTLTTLPVPEPPSRPVDTPEQPPAVPDPELVLAGLESEICRLQDANTPPGWTNWAVLAGIGTLLWLLTGILPGFHFTRANIELLIGLVLVLDWIDDLKQALNGAKSTNSGRILTARVKFGSMRVSSVLLFFRAVALAVAVYQLNGTAGSLYVISVWTIYGFKSLFLLFLIAVSMTHWAVGDNSDERVSRVVRIGVAVMLLAQTAVTVHASGIGLSNWNAGLLSEQDLKCAGILVALLYLAGKTVSLQENPAVNELIRIRRDLAFGRMEAATAATQAEIAILGFRLTDFSHKDMTAYLRLLDSSKGELTEIERERDAAVNSNGDSDETRGVLMQSMLNSVNLRLTRLAKNVGELRQIQIRINANRRHGSVEDRKALDDQLKRAFEEYENRVNALSKKLGIDLARLVKHRPRSDVQDLKV